MLYQISGYLQDAQLTEYALVVEVLKAAHFETTNRERAFAYRDRLIHLGYTGHAEAWDGVIYESGPYFFTKCFTCGVMDGPHVDGCPEDVMSINPVPLSVEWPLAQKVYTACVLLGVVVDDDLIRLDMQGRASFAPIVAKPNIYDIPAGGFADWCRAKLAEEQIQYERSERDGYLKAAGYTPMVYDDKGIGHCEDEKDDDERLHRHPNGSWLMHNLRGGQPRKFKSDSEFYAWCFPEDDEKEVQGLYANCGLEL